MGKRYCFIDNKPEFANSIAGQTNWDITPVCSNKELEDALKQTFDVWFIGVCLNWDDRKNSSFYGFELIRRLRVEHHVAAPFICFSPIPSEWFVREMTKDADVINWYGHRHVELPFDGEHAKKLVAQCDPPLTELHLAELAYSCYTPVGIIVEQFHDLSNLTSQLDTFPQKAQNSQEIIKKQVSDTDHAYIDSVFELLLQKAQQSKSVTLEIPLESIEKNKAEVPSMSGLSKTDVNHAKENIIALYRDNNAVVPFVRAENEPWYALFVDDEKHNRDQIQARLTAYGINCITASSFNEASEILHSDFEGKWVHNKKKMPANSITVLISDLRFKENNRTVFHQGYQILSDIYNNNYAKSKKPYNYGLLSFFLLTSNSGALERHMNARNPFKAFYYDKEIQVNEKFFYRFAQQVFEEGERTQRAVHLKPTGKSWIKGSNGHIDPSSAYFYRQHRLSPQYNDHEMHINKMAQDYIPKIIAVIEGREKRVTTLGLTSRIIINTKGAVDNFNKMLVGRRIALALSLISDSYTPAIISDILNKGELDKICSVLNNDIINTYLSLSHDIRSEIPRNILVEEIQFLQDMKYLK